MSEPDDFLLKLCRDRWNPPPNRYTSNLFLLRISPSRFAVKFVLSSIHGDHWIEDATVEVGNLLGEKVGDNGTHKYLTRRGCGYAKPQSIADDLSNKLFGMPGILLPHMI